MAAAIGALLVASLMVSVPVAVAASDADRRFYPHLDISQATELLVSIELNDRLIHGGAFVYQHEGDYWVPESVLFANRLSIPHHATGNSAHTASDRFIALSSLPSVRFEFNPSQHALLLKAMPSAFVAREIQSSRNAENQPPDGLTSLFLNYSTNTTYSAGQTQSSGFTEFGLTLPRAVFTSSFILSDWSAAEKLVRLDTVLTKDFLDTRTRFSLGDTIAQSADGSELGSTFRFGGVQLGTRFELEPGLVRYPLPSLYGEAFGQSSVDLFVGESLRYRTQTDTGPFIIEQPPIMNGAGDVRVVVTDLLGRETVFTTPFYVSSRLLDVGLNDYELNVGKLRHGYGVRSADYGDSFATGRFRRGLTSYLTAQVVVEKSESLELLGVSGVAAVPTVGVLGMSLAGSDSSVGTGRQLTASFERQTDRGSLGLRWKRFDADFRSLSQNTLGSRVREEISSNFRWSPTRNGSLSLIYTNREFHDATDLKLLSLTYSQRIAEGAMFSVSGSLIRGSEFSDVGLAEFEDQSIEVSIAKSFGKRRSASAKVKLDREFMPQRRQNTVSTLSFRKSIPRGLGVGYQASIERMEGQDTTRAKAGLDWSTRNAIFNLGAAKSNNNDAVNASADGSIVLMHNNVFLQRPLREGFALVDAGGYSDIGIYRGGTLVTRTNRNGYAILPELAPYRINSISIQANEFPIDAQLNSEQARVMPYFKGATRVGFGVHREYAKLVTLLDETGQALPLGTLVTAMGSGEQARVAMGGAVYLRELDQQRTFTAMYADRICQFDVDYRVDDPGSQRMQAASVVCRHTVDTPARSSQ
ncbi:fimbria/pilus outer membrane usher protein [Arenicella chitinivorans]|nr:fimbria/pilus outer membrane usher protein [Arenicella chitinivorans]